MYVDAAYCYSSVICRSVCHDREPYKNGWTNRGSVWDVDLVDGWVQGSMYYMGVHIVATWRIRLNRPCAAAVRPFCEVTLTTWYFCCVLCFERSGCIAVHLLNCTVSYRGLRDLWTTLVKTYVHSNIIYTKIIFSKIICHLKGAIWPNLC